MSKGKCHNRKGCSICPRSVADGSARDGLSLLDVALSVGEITAEVCGMLGSSDRANILDLFETTMSGDIKTALNHLEKMNQNGIDPLSIVQDLLEVVHLVTKCKVNLTIWT